ncbi:MAG: hypothetical protein AB1351_06110 [Thermoproteota archaeon]
MGVLDIFKKKKRHQTEIGKDGENYAENRLSWSHGKVERDPVGSDYRTTDVDPLTGKRKYQRYEVKVNNSRLSEKQKQTKGLRVIRLRETPLGYQETLENRRGDRLEYDYLRGRYRAVPKHRESQLDFLGTGGSSARKRKSSSWDPFGSGSSSRSRRNDDLLGGFNSNSMFGGGSSASKRRRKNDLWGF